MRHAGDLDQPPAALENVADIYPLTPAQEGMLFHTLADPGSGVYVVQYVCTLRGPLREAVLRRAWDRALERHPSLRTAILWEGLDEPLQVVRQRVQLDWTVADWQDVAPDGVEQRLQSFLAADRSREFDLVQAPLMRMALFKTDAETHRFVWTFHHVLMDGWSTVLILQEIWADYVAACRNQTAALTSPRPFRDYLAWYQGQDLRAAESYWSDYLRGFETPTPLHIDHVPTPNRQGGYAQRRVDLTATQTATVRTFARQQRLTLNTLIQGVWGLLLSRYSSTDDVVYGTTVAGRPAALRGVEAMVGLFLNTLPVRVRIDPDATPAEWLRKLQTTFLETRTYAHTPLAKIRHWSTVRGDNPLFHSLVVFENHPIVEDQPARDAGLEIHDVTYLDQSNYALALIVLPGERLRLQAVYDTMRFRSTDIDRLLAHAQTLLVGMVDSSTTHLSACPMLTPAERQHLIGIQTSAAVPSVPAQGIHHLFERQVERTPDADAVRFANDVLTYADLRTHASTLAGRLSARGVRAGDYVGLFVERSPEMISGLLGILYAGGAYVPLDPGYPSERLRHLLDDAEVGLVVTTKRLAARLPAGNFAVECIDAPATAMPPSAPLPQAAVVDPQSPAYVIYTSGSTGTPKGVAVTHGNLVFSTRARHAYYPSSPTCFLLLSPFGFDSSVAGIFWSLTTGGTLVLPQSGEEKDVLRVADLIHRHAVSHTLCVPALYALLLKLSPPQQLASLHTVIVAGEACPPSLPLRHYDRLPTVALYNEYGPTEATVWATVHHVQAQETYASIPIGRPIPGAQAYVLDSRQQPVPVGIPGELYVGGPGVARGYLNRPNLTKERFTKPAFETPAEGRLYRTGDRVRINNDGVIEFLGRMDNQVKLQGYRIEIGEIEAVLQEADGVEQAVVVARTEESGGRRLVAYVVAAASVTDAELRTHLGTRLPAYMVPSTFVMLDTLPLTPNGKLDRDALPAPEVRRPDLEQVGRPPQSEVEERLVQIWAQVLRLDHVRVDDNFFELGGDSILSIQIIALANQAGLQLSPRHIFQHQTVAELAAVSGSVEAVEAEQDAVNGPVPLTPIQHWFFEQALVQPNYFNQVLLQTVAGLNPAHLERALEHVLAHHDALRMRYRRHADAWQQNNAGVEEAGPVPFFHVDLSGLPASQQEQSMATHTELLQTSLDLEQGPLLRVVLFSLGHQQRLLTVIHHLVVDGVSWRVLLEDLETVYGQVSRGQAVVLPAKTSSFKQWSRRLLEFGQSDELAREVPYWLSVSEGKEDAARLPVDVAGTDAAANTVASSKMLVLSLGTAETQALLQEVPGAYQTQIQEVLLTALMAAFERWTGRSRLLLEVEGHGREGLFDEVDLSRTVGWFTSLYPVCLDVTGLPNSGGSRLMAIKEQLRSIPNRGIGYGVLRYLRNDAELKTRLEELPKAEVAFNYMGRYTGETEDASEPQRVTEGTIAVQALGFVAGSGRGPSNQRRHPLEINMQIVGGRLDMYWTYSERVHLRATVKHLAGTFIEELQALIAHCTSSDAGGYTPSDFPDVALSKEKLERILSEISFDSEEED